MNNATGTRSGRPHAGIETLLVTLLILTSVIICWPGMTAPHLLDDNDQLSHVAAFESWRDNFGPDVFGLFRPLKNLIFYIHRDVSLFHWHAFTLAGYLAAVIGVYALFRRLIGSPAWAFAGALLWATCPTQVSTALWMSAVNLSLSMFFSCACIIAHDLAQARPGRNAGWTIAAGLMLFMAQISYETAVAVPALCVLVDILRKRPLFSLTSLVRYGILGLLTISYLALRSHYGAVNDVKSVNFGFPPDIKAWQLSVSAPWFLWKHFSMWLLPLGRLEFGSTYIWGKSASMTELALAWCWLLALVAFAGWAWRRLPMVAVGILWFLAASFPPSNFVPIWSGPIEDYYLVFPGVGLVLILIGIAKPLAEWMQRPESSEKQYRKLFAAGLLVIAAVWRLSGIPIFWLQADVWNRPLELYLRAEATRPCQFQLQTLAARELMVAGNVEEAKLLVDRAFKDGPWYPASGMLQGYIALRQGDLPAAIEKLGENVRGTKSSPVHDFSRLHLAIALKEQKADLAVIRNVLLPLLENPQGPQHQQAIFLLFDVYLANGKTEDALKVARKAIKLHPQDPIYPKLLNNLNAEHPELVVPGSR